MKYLLMTVVLVTTTLMGVVDAAPQTWSRCKNGVCKQHPQLVAPKVEPKVAPIRTSLAQWKANRLAARRCLGHIGGGFGGGRFEGVGTGRTREQAIRNCCYWGCRTPIDIGAAVACNGKWYACVIYR